jgi:hypothetical protein
MTVFANLTGESPQYPWLLKATKLLKPYTFDESLETVKKFCTRPPPPVRRLRRRQTGIANWQTVVCGYDDSMLQFSVQVVNGFARRLRFGLRGGRR